MSLGLSPEAEDSRVRDLLQSQNTLGNTELWDSVRHLTAYRPYSNDRSLQQMSQRAYNNYILFICACYTYVYKIKHTTL